MSVCLHPHTFFTPFANWGALTGKVFSLTKSREIPAAVSVFRYYAGWADKVQGKTIEVRARLLTVGLL